MKRLLHYSLLIFILIVALFVRVYRTPDLLRFYYDQGRDALVINNMITHLKPVLVGPTTGLVGILRGPAFYYLLLPGYLLGSGSPVVAAIWLQLINLSGIYIFYLLASKLFSPPAGLLAAFFLGFSYRLTDLSRWLSNPSLILTSVPLMLYSLYQIKQRAHPSIWWFVLGLTLGLNLQFEIASEIWFLPALVLLIILSPNFRPTRRQACILSLTFTATLLPQIIFNFRHQNIFYHSIVNQFFSSEPSFSFTLPQLFIRLSQYSSSFGRLLLPQFPDQLDLFFLALASVIVFSPLVRRLSWLLPFLLLPLVILLFYSGNHGNFYSYYLLGLFPIFILLTVGFLDYLLRRHLSLLILAVSFVLVFFLSNFSAQLEFLTQDTARPGQISFHNQLQAIDAIYQTVQNQPFSVEIYVPPVIPYAYDYLFAWYGQTRFGYLPKPDQPALFYLYELDPDHPDRLNSWLEQNHLTSLPTMSFADLRLISP